jgi:hypothetical protein
MRSQGDMEITGSNFFIGGLRIISGALLSVFAPRKPEDQLNLSAATATIGIRGTGVYVEVDPDLTYVCTCYGKVSLASTANPEDSELIKTRNHDSPRYISKEPVKGTRIRKAPVINHDNDELELLEAIVGRKLPKGFGKESYKD